MAEDKKKAADTRDTEGEILGAWEDSEKQSDIGKGEVRNKDKDI